MPFFAKLRAEMAQPYRLNTSILMAASGVVLVLAGLYSVIAYQRLGRETMQSAQQWSDSVARLVANSNTSSFIINDLAAIESNLQQVATLPGIVNIAVLRADGKVVSQARLTPEGIRTEVGGSGFAWVPDHGTQRVDGQIVDNVFESWSAIETGTSTRQAWVRVHYDLLQRSEELSRLWYQSLLATAILVALVLLSLHWIVSKALRPILALSKFAEKLSCDIGSQVDIGDGCLEANQLGVALNKASLSIAEQVDRVQAIVNTAAEAIIGVDIEGRVLTANPAATSIFGRPEAEIVGRGLELCVPRLDVTVLRDLFGSGSSFSGGSQRIVRYDFFGTRADGTPFPVEISLGEVRGNANLRYACIVRDVTDERAAQETSELYERALACSHNAVFITNAKNPSQPIVYVNQAFQKVTGIPFHKALGQSASLLRAGNRHDPGLKELQTAFDEQRNASVTVVNRLPDGREVISEVSLSPVLSSERVVTNFVGIVSDVTSRVQAEKAIAERGAQLDAIFSLSPDGFVLFDAEDRLVFANPAFEVMTGRHWHVADQPMSLNEFTTSLAGLCDAERSCNLDGLIVETGDSGQARLILVRPQRRVVQAQSRRNTAGRRETILYFRDVTHEDEVDRMKSEFLASAAHELRTPMVSIFGFTELLLKRKYSEERKTDMLETIHRQSGLLVKMINELLDLARIESRRGLDLQIAAHPLQTLIQNSVKGLMRKDTDRQVDVSDVPEVPVLIDPEKMQLALSNLLSNAFKYSPQGGAVSLAARVEAVEDQQFAVIDIQDEGIGMSEEQVARAFERFYRADASGNIPGTGLGLSLVKEVAELHLGKVELMSLLGQGTTARLWVPVA